MKKHLSMLCAAMLCACCLALAACGGNASSSAAASGSASASASSEAASSSSAEASFAGTWKLAAVEAEGITMAGDLSTIIGEEEAGMALTIKEDGTGALTYSGEEAPFTWEQKSADTITLTVTEEADASAEAADANSESAEAAEASSEAAEAGSESAEAADASSDAAEASSESAEATEAGESAIPSTIDLALEDGAIVMAMEEEDFSGKAIFTADGTYADAKIIDASQATPITSEDGLVGTWTLSGMNMMGISMYGEASALSAMAGDTDTSITFDEGGKVTLMGSETAYAVSADGASIDEGGLTIPIKALGDDIIIDMTDAIGMEMVMVFSK